MKKGWEEICRDYLAHRGESPGLLPIFEEGGAGCEPDSAVLTLRESLRVRLYEAAVRAVMETPACRQKESVKKTSDLDNAADYLKPYRFDRTTGELCYIPVPQFDGETLTISDAAYWRMISLLEE